MSACISSQGEYGSHEPDADHYCRLCGAFDEAAQVTPVHTPATVPRVPNQPRTPISSFRIPEDVKVAAAARAEAEGKTLTDVIVEHLRRYGKGKPRIK